MPVERNCADASVTLRSKLRRGRTLPTAVVRPAEIGRRRILALLDDAAANRPRPGEDIEETLAAARKGRLSLAWLG